jgi:LacI family transcriptional regulator
MLKNKSNRRPTQIDVALRAGVSQATVSLVVNNSARTAIPDETRQRVYQAIDELGYRPNTLASSLRLGKTQTIGLILPDSANPFFAEVSRSIEASAFKQNYNLILCNTEEDTEKELLYVDVLCSRQVDGIIFVAVGDKTDSLLRVIGKNIPLVMVDRDLSGMEVDAVLMDNYQGGYLATEHLIQLGHRRIGCIFGPSSVNPSARRGEGYLAALKDHEISPDENLMIRGDFHPYSGMEAAHRMLNLPEHPTAIFACNDLMAIGAMRAITEAGLKVPEEISLVGFDNIELASYTNPPLTTVAQPIQEAGQRAVNLLLSRIEEPDLPFRQVMLPTSLTIRRSSGQT